MGHLTIKFNSIKFNNLGSLMKVTAGDREEGVNRHHFKTPWGSWGPQSLLDIHTLMFVSGSNTPSNSVCSVLDEG